MDKSKHIDIQGGEGQVWKRLHQAIADAFPTPQALQGVLLELGNTLGDFFGPWVEMPQGIDSIITAKNAAFHIDKLVNAALDAQPENGYLLAFALERGIRKGLPATSTDLDLYSGGDSLERMLDDEGFTNPLHLIQRMQKVVNAVCQINIADQINGTGFLIARDLVITNYHVVEKVIKKEPGFTPDRIKMSFDYQTPPDGDAPTVGREYFPVEGNEWCLHSSPYDPQDVEPGRSRSETIGLNRNTECLDYALIRVNGVPSEDLVGTPPLERGFLPIPATGPDYAQVFQGTSGVFIFQHPRGVPGDDQRYLPLRVDFKRPADVGLDENRTRVVYNVNSRKGSSGSPCLSQNLELVALHHSGGKDWPAESEFLYNQGIPFDKIREWLVEKGIWDQI